MTQLDLFAEPVSTRITVPPVADKLDSVAWRTAQNTTPIRCDRCSHWTRSRDNYWGECSVRKSYESEYGGKGCETFSHDPAEAIYRARGYDAFGRPYP